jgi:hypothetical protein
VPVPILTHSDSPKWHNEPDTDAKPVRPSQDELRRMKCSVCSGMPASAAKWSTTDWRPGKFCSCPFTDPPADALDECHLAGVAA